jgi:hypothetical protein
MVIVMDIKHHEHHHGHASLRHTNQSQSHIGMRGSLKFGIRGTGGSKVTLKHLVLPSPTRL